MSSDLKQTQSYFSALARGGLTAAISYANTQARQTEVASPQASTSYYGRQQQSYMQIYESVSDNQRGSSNGKSTSQYSSAYHSNAQSQQKENNPTTQYDMYQQQFQQPTAFQQHLDWKSQKKLQSLMSGNDLQPLEEEVSKEEDESVLMKVENLISGTARNSIQQQQQQPRSHNYTQFTFNEQVSHPPYSPAEINQLHQSLMHASQQHQMRLSSEENFKNSILTLSSSTSGLGPSGSSLDGRDRQQETSKYQQQQNQLQLHQLQQLPKGVVLSQSSLVSGDYNYNLGMEEAAVEVSSRSKAQLQQYQQQQQQTPQAPAYNQEEEGNSTGPKIFDVQFQQSYEKSSANPTAEQTVFGVSQFNTQNNSATLHQSQTFKDHAGGLVGSQGLPAAGSVNEEFNRQQKEKAKRIIESLKAQQTAQHMSSGGSARNSSGVPVERRLFDYQKRLEEKLETQRKQKEEIEKKQLRPVPHITEKSNEILMRKSMMFSANNMTPHGDAPLLQVPGVTTSQQQSPRQPREGQSSPRQYCLSNLRQLPLSPSNGGESNDRHVIQFANYQVEQKAYYEEQRRKEEVRQKMLEEKEMQGFTGKPLINKKSKSLKRKVDDLLEWKEKQDKKREQELQKKQLHEVQEIQQLQQLKVVNKLSEKMVENSRPTGGKAERVEERLTRDAQMRQKKQASIHQQRPKLYTLDDEEFAAKGGKGNRQRAKSFKRSQQSKSKSQKREKSPSGPATFTVHRENAPQRDQELKLQYDTRYLSQSIEYNPAALVPAPQVINGGNEVVSPMGRKLSHQPQPAQNQYYTTISQAQTPAALSPPTGSHRLTNSQTIFKDIQYQQFLQQQQQQQMQQLQQSNPVMSSALYNQLAQTNFQMPQTQHTLPQQQIMGHNTTYIGGGSTQLNGSIGSAYTGYQQQQFQDNSVEHQHNLAQLYNNPNISYHSLQPQHHQQQNMPLLYQNSGQGSYLGSQSQAPIPSQQYKQHQQQKGKGKQGGGQYVSLFDKLQKMNTSQSQISPNDDKESSRSSNLPVVSAMNLMTMFPTHGNQRSQSPRPCNYQQATAIGCFNPIYQSIQLESQRLQPNLVLGGNTIDYAMLQNRQFAEIQKQQQLLMQQAAAMNQQFISQQTFNTQYQQPFAENGVGSNTGIASRNTQQQHSSSTSSQQANNQDVIIYKILENSFIPSGNVNQVRRASGKEGIDSLGQAILFEGEQLPQFSEEDFELFQQQHQQQMRELNDHGLIMDSAEEIFSSQNNQSCSRSGHSDSNIVRNLNKALSSTSQQQDPLQRNQQMQAQREQLPLSRGQSTRSNSQRKVGAESEDNYYNQADQQLAAGNGGACSKLSFMDRNIIWLEQKKTKIEKAKEIIDKRQERECPFKPILVGQAQPCRSARSSTTSRSKSANKGGPMTAVQKGASQQLQDVTSSSRGDLSNTSRFSKNGQGGQDPLLEGKKQVTATIDGRKSNDVKPLATETESQKIRQYMGEVTSLARGMLSNSKEKVTDSSQRVLSSQGCVGGQGYLDSNGNMILHTFSDLIPNQNQQQLSLNQVKKGAIEDTSNCDISQLSPDLLPSGGNRVPVPATDESSMVDESQMNEMSGDRGQSMTDEGPSRCRIGVIKVLNKKLIHF